MYELTEGKVEYGKANSIVKNMYYLSKARQNAIELSNVLAEILGENSGFEDIIQHIRENKLFEKQKEIQDEQVKVEEIKQQQLDLLHEISGINREKAKELVMVKVREAMAKEISQFIKESENEAKLEVDRKAK